MPSPKQSTTSTPSTTSDAPDSLAEYDAKRDFGKTPEPSPSQPPSEPPAAATGPLTFVVQQHRATRMHYDVRLEVGGVMPSWPVPKGPSTNPRERRLAIQTEDHPLDYASFEGVIPKGQYGAGEVIVWDNGTYSPDEDGRLAFGDREEAEARVRAGIEAGKLSITFRGRKLKGSWTFVKTKASEDSWLLIKHQDVAADPDRELTAEDASVISGLTIADLQAGRLPDPAHSGTPPHLGDLPGVEPGAPPRDLKPMRADLATEPFDNPAWFFEPKLDGIRALVTIEGGASLDAGIPRRQVGDPARAQRARHHRAVPGARARARRAARRVGRPRRRDRHARRAGVPSFELLQQRMGLQNADEIAVADAERPVLFFAFDALSLDGYDLRRVALEHRAEVLARVLLPGPLVQRVETFAADGIAAFEAAKALGLEGVVAKRRDSVYEEGRRSQRWLKVKARQTGDFVIGGHHTGEGAPAGPSARCCSARKTSPRGIPVKRGSRRSSTSAASAPVSTTPRCASCAPASTPSRPTPTPSPRSRPTSTASRSCARSSSPRSRTRTRRARASCARRRSSGCGPTSRRPRCAAPHSSRRPPRRAPRPRPPTPTRSPRCSHNSTATRPGCSSPSVRTRCASRTSTR